MKILVLNCGSSSLKYQLIDMDTDEVMAKGTYERIGEQSFVTHIDMIQTKFYNKYALTFRACAKCRFFSGRG